jgi:zinc protease
MRLLKLFVAAVALSFCAAGNAQTAPQKVTSIEGVSEYRYGNGLRVLTVPDPSVDTVTVHITYFVGSRHEGYGEKGMAHLLEHLLFKGSPRHADPKRELSRRGARFNGTTSNDRTTYFETLSATEENLDWALDLEADRMLNAYVRKADLDGEMTVVRNEFEMGQNSPGSVLSERMARLVFSAHNYGNPVIGFRSDIEQVPIDRLQAFYRTWYQPDNALLVIGGRIEEDKALALVTKHFGALPSAKRVLPPLYTIEPTQDGERAVTLRRAGDIQMVNTMYRIPAGRHPDYPAIDVLVHALGSTATGRLHRALVQKGLAASAWGYDRMLHDPGYISFGATVAKDGKLEAARDALLATLETAREKITDAEVERARTAHLNDMEKAPLDSAGFVRWLSEFAAMGDWRLFFLYRDRMRKVTTADVQRVADTYLKPANRVLGMFIPTAQPERAEIPQSTDLAEALAAYKGSDAVAAGEAFDPSPTNIESRLQRRELKSNAMRAALLPKKTRGGTVNVQLSLYWGDEQSKANRGASCTLASAMLMRGTGKHSRAQLRDAFDRLKASVSVGLDGASIEVRRPQLDETLRLVAEVLRDPAFPADEFEELKRGALASAEAQRGDPSAIAGERLSRHLYPYPAGHWLAPKTVDERLAELRAATLDDAKRCYRELVGGTHAEMVAVGDFDPDGLARLTEELFGNWQSPAPYKRIPHRYFDRPPLEETLKTPDKANAVLRGALLLPIRDDHPDFAALVVGNYMLGGTSAGRLPARVREKEGLSYSTYSQFSAGALDALGTFGVGAIYAPQNGEKVENAIREELARALTEGFTDAELAAAKNGLLQARRLQRAQDGALSSRISNYLYIGRTFAWDIDLEQRIAALKPDEVRDALRRHIDPKRLSVLKAGDFK